MAKHFSKKYGTRDELQLPAILCQDACQRLMLHPYITASRTIINIVLSYVEIRHWTLRGLCKGFVRYMPSPFYPSNVVLFQLHGWHGQSYASISHIVGSLPLKSY